MDQQRCDRIIIFDTTLRDGEQSPGASMTVDEKVRIAHQLNALNVDIIEAGFPVISSGDFQAVERIANEVQGPIICGLARAVDKDIEAAGEALKGAKNRRIHTFLATSDIHLEFKLKMTRAEVLEKAIHAVELAKTYTDDVEFSAEDAARTDLVYLTQVLEAVIEAGATTVNIPDTVGYTTPEEYAKLVTYVKKNVRNIDKAVISVHCHNDLGLATANSLSAVLAGAGQIECAMNGIGERAGNCALEEVVMALKTRSDVYNFDLQVNTKELTKTSQLVSEVTGMVVQPNKAIVGKNAFSHEAGIHQHGVLANRETYEIMLPEDVGLLNNSMVIGKHSGRHALKEWLNRNNISLNDNDIIDLFEQIKYASDEHKSVSDEDIYRLIEHQKERSTII